MAVGPNSLPSPPLPASAPTHVVPCNQGRTNLSSDCPRLSLPRSWRRGEGFTQIGILSGSGQAGAPMGENAGDGSWVPKIDMVFENDEKAYQFYCLYGKEMGFGVRKHLVKRRASGLVYSRVFSCYKEGFCRTTKEGKKPRPDARTGCHAHMTVRIMDDGRFRVSEFELQHNHELIAKAAPPVMNSTVDSGIARKASQKYMNRQVRCRLPLYRCVSSKFTNARKLQFTLPLEAPADNDSLPSGEGRPPMGNAANENWVPKVGMEFGDDDEAYQFYINYAARIGFSVRKHLVKRRVSGVIYSRTYVCHKEGYQRGKDQQQARDPKPYDRTGCLASMTIKITKNGRYRVAEIQPKHNHPLVIPTKAHLFKWQWRRGLIRTQDDMAGHATDDLGVTPKPCKQKIGYKNYITSRRKPVMKVGDVGAVLQYLQEKQVEDPSFYYALQLDEDDHLRNFFWTDAKSIVSFEHFGDVLCFDTTYKTRDHGKPFTQFIGVNHHKQAIIFGAALLYDETEKSFEWLFETFKTAMHGKQPEVILTDRSLAMSNAVVAVWPGTTHRICAWHMFNSAAKHLNFVFQGSITFANDFSRCIYDLEEEDEFVCGWKTMLEKYDLGSNEWLRELYKDREKWASAYGRETFSADIKNTLIREYTNDMLKEYLYPELNLLNFFKNYERILQEQRDTELQLDFHARESTLKMPTSRMLRQAADAYTPTMFKTFQREFELSMDCMVYGCGQAETAFVYKVTNDVNPKEYIVRFDSSNGSVFCSCKKFEFVGIQCRHVLKTLDIINIKELPPQYILKRWTKDAKCPSPRGICDIATDGETRSSRAKRYGSLCCIFNRIAARAAETVESYVFIESLSDQLMDQVYQILQTRSPEKPQAT